MTEEKASARDATLHPHQRLPGRLGARLIALCGASLFFSACGLRHWAEIESSPLPPPPGEKEIHSGRLIVQVMPKTKSTQCLKYERYRPICYEQIRSALEAGLVRSLWPAFPEVVVGDVDDATPNDYILQVDAKMDALPPDTAGPGWSAGAKLRYRLLRDAQTLKEATTASRSRAEFAYGAPLGGAGTEVINASILHIADQISRVPEERPFPGIPLPQVAAKEISVSVSAPKSTPPSAKKTSSQKSLSAKTKSASPR